MINQLMMLDLTPCYH
uniref:Uncharacterized protein n=1 Tax=Amphimedon queenslandica TaxID=400682 RepID=A0A1X7VCG1_AMPQE